MNTAAKRAIEALYDAPDRRAIAAAFTAAAPVVDTLLAELRAARYGEVNAYPERVYASINVNVTLQDWIDSSFRSRVRISRLAQFFHIEHHFQVKNPHSEPTEPFLHGFADSGYIEPQVKIHEQTKATLEGAGYTELSLWEMDYPVEMLLGTPAHTDNRLPTVRQALFEDLFDVLDDE